MTRRTLLIDLDRCIGCYTCRVACKQENGLSTDVSRNEVIEIGPVGTYPDLKGYFLPLTCMHCENPPCVEACPTGASHRREDGVVLINHDDCILCEKCIKVCPYGARSISFINHRIESCNLCAQRIDEGNPPACVAHCMGQALIFGDMDDLQGELRRYLNNNGGRKINWLQEQPSHPGVIYLAPRCGTIFEMEDIFLKRYKKVEKRKETSREKTYKNILYLTWARGGIYRLLSRIWGEELDEALWGGLKNIRFGKIPQFPVLKRALSQLEKTLSESYQGTFDDLATDYFNILQNVAPYESVYRSSEGLMMQEEWEEIVKFYSDVGLRRSESMKEPEDHIALELECMGYLCNRMLQELKAQKYQEAQIKLNQQSELLDSHILRWAPSLMDKVIKLARTDFYRVLAKSTVEILRLDSRMLKKINLPKSPE